MRVSATQFDDRSLARDMWMLCIAAFAIRFLFFIFTTTQIGISEYWSLSPDVRHYLEIAQGFTSGSSHSERFLFTFGPGYAAFLWLILLVTGQNAYAVITLQLIMSAMTCAMVYLLASRLSLGRWIALIAGSLFLLSTTSISLCCLILSDTVFLFLLIIGLLLLLRGLRTGAWSPFIVSSLVTTSAIVTRTIGQFWPVIMLVIAIPWLVSRCKSGTRRSWRWDSRLILKVSVCLLIIVVVEAAWMHRNFERHGIAAMSSGGSGGLANVAAFAKETIEGRPYREIREQWHANYVSEHGLSQSTISSIHEADVQAVRVVWSEHPVAMVKSYLSLTWENAIAVNHLNRTLLPDHKDRVIKFEYFLKDLYTHYLGLVAAILGLLILILRRQYRAAITLGLVFAYYLAMIGFTRWQGSRLFFPSQIATTTLAAVVLFQIGQSARQGWRLVLPRLKWMRIIRDQVSALLKTIWQHNFENDRYFVIGLGLALAIGLAVIFREFLFHNELVVGGDSIIHGAFYRRFLWDSISTYGYIPLWNPYIQCGLPFVAAIHGSAYYPLQVLDLIGNSFRGFHYTVVLHYLGAGLFTYAAARQMKLKKVAAGFAAVTYMFAPCLISWVTPGHVGKIYCASLFPLVILFLSRIFERRRLVDAAILGIVLGIVVLTGHVQMAYYVFWAVAFYSLWKTISLGRMSCSKLSACVPVTLVVLAIILGLSISSMQLLPAYEHLTQHSIRSDSAKGQEFAGRWSIHEEELVSHIVPEFSGVRSWAAKYWGKNPIKDNSENVGLIAIFAALLALTVGRFKERYLWATMGLLALVYSLGHTTPFFKYFVEMVPLAKSMRGPSSISFIFCFSVAILGGAGVQSLVTDRLDPTNRRALLAKSLLVAIPVLLLILTAQFTLFGEEMLRTWARLFHASILPNGDDIPLKWTYAVANLSDIQQGFWIAFLAATVVSVVFWIGMFRLQVRGLLIIVLCVLTAVVSGRYSSKFVTPTGAYDTLFGNDVADYLSGQPKPFRAIGNWDVHNGYRLQYYGIESTIGPHNRTLSWYDALGGGVGFRDRMNARFVNLTNTSYIISPTWDKVAVNTYGSVPLDTVAKFEQEAILLNRNCFPRAYMVQKYEVIPDRQELPWLVLHGDVDLRDVVYLEEEPNLPIVETDSGAGTAAIVHYEPDSIAIRLDCSADGILVLSDNYHPDWRAFVDGVETKVYRAYGSFRAVPTQADTREVVFIFDPWTFRLSKYLTMAGLVCVLSILGFGLVSRYRR